MRRLLVFSVAAVLAACSSGGTTGPDANVINVRVVDDIGTGVGRMPVTAIMSNGASVRGVTREDGTVKIGVADAGTYQVSVVPRDGYLRGVDPLVRTISVSASESASIQFLVSRAGISTAETPPQIAWW